MLFKPVKFENTRSVKDIIDKVLDRQIKAAVESSKIIFYY